MPVKVAELKEGLERSSIRGKTLELLKKNPALAYTLKEIHAFFLEKDKNSYKSNKILYKLIYNYLRDFAINKTVIHKGNYYYYNKKVGVNEKKSRK